jgi:tetratricopeptide (TPR) repeat protein
MKKVVLALMIIGLALNGQAQKKSYAVKQGDKAFSLFNFRQAIDFYSVSLKKKKKTDDTTYVKQQIADAYRQLNDPENAEIWYRSLVTGGNTKAMNSFWLAEALRANQKYDEAKKYYNTYKAATPGDANVDEILAGIDNLQELTKDKGVFRIDLLNINSAASDFGPAIYKDGQIFFSSNRNAKRDNNLVDNWSTRNFYQMFIGSRDSGSTQITKLKNIGGCKPNGKFHDGPQTYYAPNNELIFTRSNYINSKAKTAKDKKTVNLKLFTLIYPAKKKSKLISFPFNSDQFSNAHPAISADGNMLYFSSDRPGGQGGTDLYVSKRENGVWTEPKNLGTDINSRFDEKFPFMATDGTLYFSSNALDGLGGLDIYKTKIENDRWTKPQNLGVPMNSNRDDFGVVMTTDNKEGYFTSNRAGGVGDDDIYHFTYDETKLNYKVTVRVIDAVTKKPIDLATLALDCKTGNPENTLTDLQGERLFTIKGGRVCTVDAMKDGYKPNSGTVTSKDKNGVVVIELKSESVKLIVSVKEKETMQPIRDVAVAVRALNKPQMSYATEENGEFNTRVAPGTYGITSPDYASIVGSFTDKEADAEGIVRKEFLIPRAELVVNVPLTANCFSGEVSITDLKTGQVTDVIPNSDGEVRLDLRSNNKYVIFHNGVNDTISTYGLKPGCEIDGPCKFYVGQTWIISNIYYDLDKSFIRPDAAKELDNLVRVMKENPTLEVELSSHTDCRQTQKYNMSLSARRARAAVDYIVGKGVKVKRIIAAGYGETKLVNGCECEPTNESPCTDPQHQANRRTEVKVLKY